MKNIAIVTGASSGTGKLYVEAFDHGMGGPLDEIWIIARREDKLEEIKKSCKNNIRVFALDLCVTESFDVIEQALADDPEIVNVQWLVNNAGFGKFGDFTQIASSDNADMVSLNCLAVVEMCYRCLMYMHAGSRIINMSSVASFLPQAYLSVYASTKRFVLDFSRSLDFELKDVGIRTVAVCPKFMHTEFLDQAGDTDVIKGMTSIGFEDPTKVVRKAIKCAVVGKTTCIPSNDMKLVYAACKVLPYKLAMKTEQLMCDYTLNH